MSEKPAEATVPEETLAPVPSEEDAALDALLAEADARAADAEARAAAAEAKLAEREKALMERLARLQADFENFRRRSREDAAQSAARGKLDFVKALVPVLDNLGRALAHTEDEGLRLLARQIDATLAAEGLVVIEPTGEAFDARVHEAIAQEAREGVESGTVVATVEKGYALEGRVLRPARVVVAP